MQSGFNHAGMGTKLSTDDFKEAQIKQIQQSLPSLKPSIHIDL
jgi:hypothetical protein